MSIPIYVPADDDRHLRDVIEPGSGIVARAPLNKDMRGLMLFYEGSLNGSQRTLARKIADACKRCPLRYPTIGTILVEPESVLEVGVFEGGTRTVQVTDAERLARWLGIKVGSYIPAHQLVDYLAPVTPIKYKDPREVQRERYAANRGPVPPLPPEPDIRIELGPSVSRFTAVAEKLNPNRFPGMDSKLAAIVGFILGDRFTNAARWETDAGSRISELTLTNGEVVKRDEGESSFQAVCTESVLVSNWKGLLDAAGLTAIERTMAQESFYKRVVTGGGRFYIAKPSKKPKEKTPEKPAEPWKFYRKVTPYEENAIAETMEKNPGLTREDCLREMEAFGF